MDPIERKRQLLEAKQAARQARAREGVAPPAPAPEGSGAEASEAAPAAGRASLEEGGVDELDPEAVRAKLTLERELLELERRKLALERERLALESGRATEPAPPPAPARPRPSAARAIRSSARLRAQAGGAPAGAAPRRRPRAAEAPVLLAVLGGVLAFASVGALLYVFGDRSKLPMLGAEPGGAVVSPPEPAAAPPPPSEGEPPPERDGPAVLEGLRQRAVSDPEAKLTLGLALWNGTAGDRDPVAAEAWVRGAALTGQGLLAERAREALRRIAAQQAAGTLEPITDRELRVELARRAQERAAQREAAQERAAREEEERAREEQERGAERRRALESARDQAPVLVDELSALEALEPLLELEPDVAAALLVLRGSEEDAPQLAPLIAALEQARAAARRRVLATAAEALRARVAAGRQRGAAAALGPLTELARLDRELAADLNALRTELTLEAQRLHEVAREARAAQVRAVLGRSEGDPAPALAAALEWLAAHQGPDGRWYADGWTAACQGGRCVGPGTDAGAGRYDVGVTALALLAFLERGHTAPEGPYGDTVARALGWLLTQQAPSGAIGFDQGETIYNHAIATKAFSRALALGVSAEPRLSAAAARAVRFCQEAQNSALGWKYGIQPGRNDTSVTGWMVQALLAARGAGLEVREDALAGAVRWFGRATDAQGRVGYETPGGGSAFLPQNDGKYDPVPCMTAVAVACRLALGEAETAPALRSGLQHLAAALPTWAPHVGPRTVNFYYWYHGALAAQRTSLERTWRLALQQALLPNQRVGGCADGSWDGVGEWCLAGGRVYATAINALALAVGAAPAAAPAAPRAAPAGARVVVASKGGGPGPGVYLVRGRLRNEGGAPATRVRVTIVLLDAEGRELFVIPAEAPPTLAPGGEADYSLTYRGEHVSLVRDFEVHVTCAEGEAPEAPKQEGAEPAPAASPPGRAPSAERRAAVEAELRQRVQVWLRARSAAALRCYRCDLREQVRCDPCGGDGRRNLWTPTGVYASPCADCGGRGVVACPDEGCLRGYRRLSLKRTFWDVLSPEARAARDRKAFLREVASGSHAELIGSTPIVREAELIAVELGERAARVTARIRWGTAAAETSEWTSTWIRARGRLYLATAEDRAPGPLVPR